MTIKEIPKLSVVIPVYNREAYLGDAIDSILAQTLTDFELLVIDDGSTDRSCEVAQSYDDPRIRLVRNRSNMGIPKTRNEAVRLARGEYLAFLDSDDVAYPDRLARQVAFLDSHPDYAAVGAWVSWMAEDGQPLKRIKRKPVSPEELGAQRLFRSVLENSASMARTSILLNFPHREDLCVEEDFDMWSRVAAKYKVGNLPEVLVRRRKHAQRTTEEQRDLVKKMRMMVYASQLTALGLRFSDTDLERHFLLRRMHKQKFTPDQTYLDWAEHWLLSLQDANDTAQAYPEPAFSHELGLFWAKTCLYAFRNVGWKAWQRFFASPLRSSAWSGVWKYARLQSPVRLATAP
jgi:glycosyltransferase involved in cell wall biosynthesis